MSVVSRVSDARLQRAVAGLWQGLAQLSLSVAVFFYEEFGRTKNVSTQRTPAVFGVWRAVLRWTARVEFQAALCWYHYFILGERTTCSLQNDDSGKTFCIDV